MPYNYVQLDNVKPLFANFDGHKDRFGNVGKKSLVLELSKDQYDILKAHGASVVMKEFEDGCSYRLPVAINFRKTDGTEVSNPPKIYRVTPKGKRLLTEKDVADLQEEVINYIDCTINLWEWDKEAHRIKAYIAEMYVNIQENDLRMKYSDIPELGAQQTPSVSAKAVSHVKSTASRNSDCELEPGDISEGPSSFVEVYADDEGLPF